MPPGISREQTPHQDQRIYTGFGCSISTATRRRTPFGRFLLYRLHRASKYICRWHADPANFFTYGLPVRQHATAKFTSEPVTRSGIVSESAAFSQTTWHARQRQCSFLNSQVLASQGKERVVFTALHCEIPKAAWFTRICWTKTLVWNRTRPAECQSIHGWPPYQLRLNRE